MVEFLLRRQERELRSRVYEVVVGLAVRDGHPLGSRWLIDRLGRKSVMAGSIFLYSFSPFLAAYSTTLPMFIFAMLRRGIKPEINAIAVMMLTFSFLVASLGLYLRSRQK